MTVTTASRYAKASREELLERIDELQGEVEGREGEIAYLNERIVDLNERIVDLDNALQAANDTRRAETLIGIRDDLRAGQHSRALSRLTAWLDDHVDLWRTLGPEKAIDNGPALPLEDAA